MNRSMSHRLVKLETPPDRFGRFSRTMGAFREIGSKRGVLRVPIVTPEQWCQMAKEIPQ